MAKLVDKTVPAGQPSVEAPKLAPFYTPGWSAELGALNYDQWLVPGIVPANGLVVLASAPKVGKTAFASSLATAVATGADFIGKPVQPGPVFWCSHEETVQERYVYLSRLERDIPLYTAYPTDLPFLDVPGLDYEVDRYGRATYPDPPLVFERARDHGGKLIVIDSLHAAVRSWNLADNNAARRIMSRLRVWSSAYNVAVLVLHHVTKSATRGYHPERFADSSQILAAASCHHFLEAVVQPDGTRNLTLHSKGRHPAPPPVHHLFSPDLYTYLPASDPAQGAENQTIAEKVCSLLSEHQDLTSQQISDALDANRATIRCTLADLLSRGRVAISSAAGAYPKTYRLSSLKP